MGLVHVKSIRLWWGIHMSFLLELLIAMHSEYCLIFALLYDMYVIILYLS